MKPNKKQMQEMARKGMKMRPIIIDEHYDKVRVQVTSTVTSLTERQAEELITDIEEAICKIQKSN